VERARDRAALRGRFRRARPGDEAPDEARRFDFAMTFDRELVSAASAILMQRVSPSADVLV
jgi:hypothetical protein